MWLGKEGVGGLEASVDLLTRQIILHLEPSLDLDKGHKNRGSNWGREIALRKFLLSSFVWTQGRVAITFIPLDKHSLGYWRRGVIHRVGLQLQLGGEAEKPRGRWVTRLFRFQWETIRMMGGHYSPILLGGNLVVNGGYHRSPGTEGLKNPMPEKPHSEGQKREVTLFKMMLTYIIFLVSVLGNIQAECKEFWSLGTQTMFQPRYRCVARKRRKKVGRRTRWPRKVTKQERK